MRGCFISFEGAEAVGKSTLIAHVAKALEQRGVEILVTREPGGTPVGEQIRAVLLDGANGELTANSELLLMFASRAQLVAEVIEPALAKNTWVLCDRFTDSSFAYQGGGRGLDSAFIEKLERETVGVRPDLTFLLDLPADGASQRFAASGRCRDRIESERQEFFERVRFAYAARAEADSSRWRILDAQQPEATLADLAMHEILALLPGVESSR